MIRHWAESKSTLQPNNKQCLAKTVTTTVYHLFLYRLDSMRHSKITMGKVSKHCFFILEHFCQNFQVEYKQLDVKVLHVKAVSSIYVLHEPASLVTTCLPCSLYRSIFCICQESQRPVICMSLTPNFVATQIDITISIVESQSYK